MPEIEVETTERAKQEELLWRYIEHLWHVQVNKEKCGLCRQIEAALHEHGKVVAHDH